MNETLSDAGDTAECVFLLALMADRYFVETPIEGSSTQLAGSEAHHLLHVMRAKPGDDVTLFDGSGAEFSARVRRAGRAEVELDIVSRAAVDRELDVPVTLGVALPKGDRQKWLVEKATELGVGRLVPLITEHSQDRVTPAGLDKLRRAVIEASKQCGRNRLMEIAEPLALDTFLSADSSMVRVLAHPEGKCCVQAVDAAMALPATLVPVLLAVGPEGGFTVGEVAAAKSRGWEVVDLGRRILRVETAAVSLVSAIVAWLETGRHDR